MLAALRCAARQPASSESCLPTIKARLGRLKDELPDDTAMTQNISLAYQELAMAALVDPVGDGRFAITPRGTALLESHPQGIDGSVLERYPEYRDYVSAIARPKSPPAGVEDDGVVHEPEHAYFQGLESYRRGFDLDENPYDPDSAAHQEWSNGWSNAENEAVRGKGRRPTRKTPPR